MTRRLLLSYLALIVLIVTLMALVIQQVTERTFSQYLRDQAAIHSEMMPMMLAGYYDQSGSWDGVQPDIMKAGYMIGASLTLADPEGHIVASTQTDLVGQSVAGLPSSDSAIPVMRSDGMTIGTVYLKHSQESQRADEVFLAGITRALVFTGVAVALLAAMMGVFLARSINRPLTKVGQAAARFASGDYSARAETGGSGEVATLGRTFNQMAESVGGLEQLRRKLVADVSHDLRTPLTVIRGYLEGLRSGQIADRRSAEMAFEAMHGEVSQLLALVDDLREVAALDRGPLTLKRHPIQVEALVRQAARRVEPLASAKGIRLESEVAPDLPLLDADEERLGQALFNLLENAVRYTPAGGAVTLAAERLSQTLLHLSVRDTGPGIPVQHLPHVFERFYRADQARSRSKGSGLGLAIVKSIVDAHHGRVEVASDLSGSIFTIDLPLTDSEEKPPRPPKPAFL